MFFAAVLSVTVITSYHFPNYTFRKPVTVGIFLGNMPAILDAEGITDK
jgi:hypothetical protein